MILQKKTIDSHVHLYGWEDVNGVDYFQLFDELQQALGLEGVCIACLTDPIYGCVENNIMAALYKLHNPTAYAHGAIAYPTWPVSLPLPEGMDLLTQYREMVEIGFDGLKILYKPDVQKLKGLPIDHEVYEPLFAQMEKDGTHIIWHVADPAEFWSAECKRRWNYSDGTYPSYEALMEQTLNVLKKHPKLCVTFAHFMFLSNDPERLEELFATYPNVAIDITPGAEMYVAFFERRDFYRTFFEKYGDRIIFGSDSGIPSHHDNEGLITSVYQFLTEEKEISVWGLPTRGLKLSESTCRLILRDNFLRRSGASPKPINGDALRRYAIKYLPWIKKEENKARIIRRFEL